MASLTVNNSSITSNAACGAGGGIATNGYSNGLVVVTLNNSSIDSNMITPTDNSRDGFGGGIFSDGPTALTVNNSSIALNRAAIVPGGSGAGGGIYISDANKIATLLVNNSSIISNTASVLGNGAGGGIVNSTDTKVTLSNSTVAFNTASANGSNPGSGGGLYGLATITVTNSSIVSNNAGSGSGSKGGGIRVDVNMGNTILANNTAPHEPDASDRGNINSLDYNLIGVSNGNISGSTSHNIYGQNPLLNPLANNGGPTLTLLPQNSSPAINAGGDSCPATDQRGVTRPQGAHCDIGAVEVGGGNGPIAPIVQLTASAPAITPTLTFTINNPNSTPLTNIGLADDLPFGLNFGAVTANSCSGSNLTLTSPSLLLSSLNLAGNDSCAVTVSLNGTPGTYSTATQRAILLGLNAPRPEWYARHL